MRALLDKHRRAELAAAEERCSEKAGALDVAGKTWKQVLGARVAYHGQLVREGADIAARNGTEGEARKTETSRARKVYEERLRYAQEQLDAFIAEDARREAQWTAHFADLAEKNEARVRAAEAAVAKVKQAVEAAGDAADRVITEAEAAEWAKAMGGDGGINAATGDGDTGMNVTATTPRAARTAATTPATALVPDTPPPPLAAPTTDEDRGRLLKAKLIVHHWLQQDEDWPVSYENLGLQPQEVAVLVGVAVWTRHDPSDDMHQAAKPLKRGLFGTISCALKALRVSTAAVVASAQAAAAAAMESVEAAAKRRRAADGVDESML